MKVHVRLVTYNIHPLAGPALLLLNRRHSIGKFFLVFFLRFLPCTQHTFSILAGLRFHDERCQQAGMFLGAHSLRSANGNGDRGEDYTYSNLLDEATATFPLRQTWRPTPPSKEWWAFCPYDLAIGLHSIAELNGKEEHTSSWMGVRPPNARKSKHACAGHSPMRWICRSRNSKAPGDIFDGRCRVRERERG